ncbi:MAG: glycosyltransferase [Candidatus Peribacteraceae bacterium]|nr:glycosyltransferase [Candidatus Peribacteraceae bacterium]
MDKNAINSRNLRVRSDRVAIWGATGRYYALREWCGTLPGVDVYPREIAGHNATSSQYYRRITDFDAAICAVSENPCVLYPVAKINEIAASGALLFVQEMPDLALHGWNETNCVPFTRHTLPEKLQEYRRNPESYLPIREAGRQLVIGHHTIERRIDELEGIISILSK